MTQPDDPCIYPEPTKLPWYKRIFRKAKPLTSDEDELASQLKPSKAPCCCSCRDND